MSPRIALAPRSREACALARAVLAVLPQRWRHTIGVASRAEELAVTVPADDRELLIAAAWLHDIGYGPAVHATGFHPLDGARYLADHGWPRRICALVAHHSGAAFAAGEHGLRPELAEFEQEHSPVADALTYADQTVGPDGQRLPIRARMAEVLARHGKSSVQGRIHHLRAPYLLAVADRVEQRIGRSGARR